MAIMNLTKREQTIAEMIGEMELRRNHYIKSSRRERVNQCFELAKFFDAKESAFNEAIQIARGALEERRSLERKPKRVKEYKGYAYGYTYGRKHIMQFYSGKRFNQKDLPATLTIDLSKK